MSERDPRPFRCPHPGCGWAFSRQEHQTHHLLTHIGGKPYACDGPDCVARFAQKDELKRHQLLTHRPASSRYEGALADTDQVIYNGYGRRPQNHYASSSSRPRATCTPGSRYGTPHGTSSGARSPFPTRPMTSMNYNPSSSYARQLPPPASSGPVAHPAPSYPSRASFTPLPPATPMHPALPLHSRTPTARRASMPVTLPPLQSEYTIDRGQSERSVRLPGLEDILGQPRDSESSRNRERGREHE